MQRKHYSTNNSIFFRYFSGDGRKNVGALRLQRPNVFCSGDISVAYLTTNLQWQVPLPSMLILSV